MRPDEAHRLFQRHREAEAARDHDAILATFVEDCFLETHPLGLRSEGRAAARAAYEGCFRAFPDLQPDDEGVACGADVMVLRGTLRGTSGGGRSRPFGRHLRGRLPTSLRSRTG